MPLNLDALLEQAGLAGLQDVPMERIIPNPANPRRDFDIAELDALAASIMKRGLLQPISLFPVNSDGVHVIRFGERRFRAANLAGLPTIKAVISDVDVPEAQLVDQIIENDQRVGLTAREMSEAISSLVAAGMSKAAIAGQLGRAPTMITLYAALPDMPPLLQDLADRVSIRSLHDLYRIWRRHPDAVVAFVGDTPADQISRRAVVRLADALADGSPSPPAVRAAAPDRNQRASLPAPDQQGPGSPSDAGQVRVRHAGRDGSLLFPAPPLRGSILIRLDGDAMPIEVDPAAVTIVAALGRP